MSRITAIVIGAIGFILSLPFVFDMIFGAASAVMPLYRVIFTIVFVFALPMFFFGVIGFFSNGRTNASSSTVEGELGRIRHAVEMDRMTRR